jgi:transcriptional regulator with XRE-family HTH domain
MLPLEKSFFEKSWEKQQKVIPSKECLSLSRHYIAPENPLQCYREAKKMNVREECPELRGVGDKIRSVRVWRDLSQNQLSYRAGVSQKMISLYETGKQRPTIEILCRISKALSVDINSFLEWDLERKPLTVYVTEVVREPRCIEDPELLKRVLCESIDAISGQKDSEN